MGATGRNRVSRVFWKAQGARDVLGFGLALAARQFTTKYHPELGFGIMPQKNFPTSPYKVCIIAIRGGDYLGSQQVTGLPERLLHFPLAASSSPPRDWSEHASNAQQGIRWMIEIWALRLLSGLLLCAAFWPRMFFPASTRKSQITNYAYARPRSQYQANARRTANDHR